MRHFAAFMIIDLRQLWKTWLALALASLFLVSCATTQAAEPVRMQVNLTVDGETIAVQVPEGSTIVQVLSAAGVSLGALDRTEPLPYTVLNRGMNVRVIRVTEKFEIEQVVIPFEQKILYNESLPLGDENRYSLQEGKNGIKEITYRHVFEDGTEVSSSPIKAVVLEEPVPQIWMKGVQAPFVPVVVPGKLIYLRDGNAWLIEETTGNRRAVVTTGDLDGYIFSLSEDGKWLLFTRAASVEGQINSLWAAQVDGEADTLVDLDVENVIYFADWLPGSTTQVAYSTVEPQISAPGWRTNNDLNVLTIFKSQRINKSEVKLSTNIGGVYPWWGISFAWGIGDGLRLVYANDHEVGVLGVSLENNVLKEIALTSGLKFNPLQTHASWAWVPGVTWGPDGNVLYTVDHIAPPGMAQPEESQIFDLAAVPLNGGAPLRLVSQVGMFAYPLASPQQPKPTGEQAYQIAYLQAAFPNQSETSRYRVVVMDRDGSNRRALFPVEGTPGLSPQREWGAWSPAPLPESGHTALAVIYQSNLWLVDVISGETHQITGDNRTSRVAWNLGQ